MSSTNNKKLNYETTKTTSLKTLTLLLEQYKDNDYILNKLNNEINNALEKTLKSFLIEHNECKKSNKIMKKKKEDFTCRFLNKHNYFYLHATNLFLYYNKKHYILYNEDDIVHEILTMANLDRDLHHCKHIIKNNIIKIIKNRNAYDYIPETETIQNVQQFLYPFLFKNKYHVKYFLTILGDIILKKKLNLIYIISPKFGPILKDISNYCYNFFGHNQIYTAIKFKYYDHDYKDCRLLMVNDVQNNFEFPEHFYKHILDLFCVSLHYSKRYGSSDEYLAESYETELVNHALFLKNTTQENIIITFIDNTLQKSDSGSNLDMKNMLFLWKKYLKKLELPNIIFQTTLKAILKKRLEYDENNNCFLNITSTHLPLVADFIKFWHTTISEDPDSLGFEADELVCLFKQYLGKSSIVIKDDMLIEWIMHYYPHINITNSKYIHHISNKNWDKCTDVFLSIVSLKQQKQSAKSLDDFYKYYCKFAKEQKFIFVMSKYYFDLIAPKYLDIDNDGMVI